MRQALIIGLGNFGMALVKELVDKGSEIIVIENDPQKAQQVRDLVNQVIIGDATNRDLLAQFAKDVDVAVVCLSERIDSSVLVTHFLKDIGVKKIMAKAASYEHGEILRVLGVDEVIFPESDTAKRLATSLISPDVLDFIKVSSEFDIVEIAVPDNFLKKTIKDLDLRNKFGVEVLAVKNALSGEVRVVPPPDYQFKPDDILIALGEVQNIQKIKIK